ncbi:aldehyde dehydrogenase family protein [Trichothermofontia sp.]
MDTIAQQLDQQRQFFATGRTRPLAFRRAQLQQLRRQIVAHEAQILEALHTDLRKPQFEAYGAEIYLVLEEIDRAIKHLPTWMRPQRVKVPPMAQPGRAMLIPEPLGVVLIISPWNYPFQLSLLPLVGAIAAGNCAVLKPSEIASATATLIADLIKTTFDPAFVCVVTGGPETSQRLLAERFDHIFFTGGTAIGKLVMAAAAQHLTPVTLELGGKSPCLVDRDIDLVTTARRIVWGKFANAGQTCIAPDYLLVDRAIHAPLLTAMQTCLREFYGDDPAQSPDYARIINDRHFQRLTALLSDGQIVVGGETNAGDRYIAPTILDHVSPDAPVMQEEIFGPILPVLTYDTLEDAIAFVNDRPKPLALYCFSRNPNYTQPVLAQTSSGGVCINDILLHNLVPDLGFGGVGPSGMGRYHGKASFDTFSHQKGVLQRPFWLDLRFRYPPYTGTFAKFKALDRFLP